MWSMAFSLVIVAAIAAFSLASQSADPALRQAQLAALAESMALYRTAVMRYFGAHDGQRDTGVDLATLRSAGALPAWAALAPGRWDNYRAPDGTIYVYGTEAAAGVGAALARQSYNSILAGTYRSASATLDSPGHGGAGISLAPLLARRTLRDGVPVWLAAAP